MHDPQVSRQLAEGELLRISADLADPSTRAAGADKLARLCGAEAVLFFGPDPELGVLLPAQGLLQAIPRAAEWREFVKGCSEGRPCDGTLQWQGRATPVHGVALADGTAAVLVGRTAVAGAATSIRPLLPMLGALFRLEREASAQKAKARVAADAAERANTLAHALQQMRERLETALDEARAARAEARQRAEQAEALAVELRTQAEQLQDQALELELLNDELTKRSAEADRARAAADAANQAKSEFLASMSHELRTPINAVIGYVDLLEMGIPGAVTDLQRRQLERIRASSSHLLKLINDVLDLSKIEAGRMSMRSAAEPVATVIREATEVMAFQADNKEIDLVNAAADWPETFLGDRDRVRQILVNLLTNAIKFTPEGGRITISGNRTADVSPREDASPGPWIQISVSDTGIGIAAEERPKIFNAFEQAESGLTRRHSGTGLGLTISRQLARLMGGDLTVESRLGEGSTFTLWLQPVPEGHASSESNAEGGGAEEA